MTVTLRVGAGDLVVRRTSFPIVHAWCDERYPDVCIPPPEPVLDCAAVTYKNIKVDPPGPDDPHGLDPDGDGMGCEWPDQPQPPQQP